MSVEYLIGYPISKPTLHDELFEMLETASEWLDDGVTYCLDCEPCANAQIETLIEIISRHPPPRKLKYWCMCGWVGTDMHHGEGPDHTGLAWKPIKGHDLCECGKMPWEQGK